MIGVIDYGAGNIRSISRGLIEAGGEVFVADNGAGLAKADALVLPGVGHVGQLMQSVRDRGIDLAIKDAVTAGKPYLGICVGMQIMYGEQEEGGSAGLGLLPGRVVHLPKHLKTPHMGWSLVDAVKESPLGPVGFSDYFYFVHSYAAESIDGPEVVATTSYGSIFPSVVIADHLWGCQFHPEKSSRAGIAFLHSFVEYVDSRVTTAAKVAVG